VDASAIEVDLLLLRHTLEQALDVPVAVGGVSRSNGRSFMRTVNDRSEDTLMPLVARNTDPCGLILTDEWGGY
jgi:hypothetical protein